MWFSKSAEAVLKELGVDPAYGHSDKETLTRLKESGGKNHFPQIFDWLNPIIFSSMNHH